MSWKPTLGAWPEDGGVRFRVWAPLARWVHFIIGHENPSFRRPDPECALTKDQDGFFVGWTDRLPIGGKYGFEIDGENGGGPYPYRSYPDPASRFQFGGVDGGSEVIDPSRFPWTDQSWQGIDRDQAIIYELHVGTFSPEGTFEGVTKRLAELADLGVTAVQLLPVNDFPGRWNWGYDGVSLFAPARCYGRPHDLRRLVDEAHSLGMAVLLDVVYNHFGPDGNYTGQFSPHYVRPDRSTPWGPAINLGGEHSAMVREFFFENARMWIHEYHFDGFRLDATHAFVDDGSRPFLEEFSEVVRASCPDRKLILIAEDHRNLDTIIRPASEGGWNFDGVWSDDFHHQMRRHLTGDSDGVFQDFSGTMPDIATTINRGWFFTGEHSAYREQDRGTDPSGISPQRFVFCLQNHDRVGNRAGGRRLNHDVDLATYRAATVALLCSPETPMLFMGQEWAASSPFFYFTDHNEELGRLVREGRVREFAKYSDFTDPARLATIPDPQLESTFLSSKLDLAERYHEPHASILRLYRALLRLRRDEATFRTRGHIAYPLGGDGIAIHHAIDSGSELVAIIRFEGSGPLSFGCYPEVAPQPTPEAILTTEDPTFAPDPIPIRLDLTGLVATLHFERPGAAILRYNGGPS
jgi:maltooligosyltrehalose trehalohydrolase